MKALWTNCLAFTTVTVLVHLMHLFAFAVMNRLGVYLAAKFFAHFGTYNCRIVELGSSVWLIVRAESKPEVPEAKAMLFGEIGNI